MESLAYTIVVELVKQIPAAVAIIIVVIYFLKYNEKLVETWQAFIEMQNKQNNKILEKMSDTLNEIEASLKSHDIIMRGAVDDMKKARGDKSG